MRHRFASVWHSHASLIATLWRWFVTIAMLGLCLAGPSLIAGCRPEVMPITGQRASVASLACRVGSIRFPTTADDFNHLLDNRSFYADGKHLGRDIQLPEGTPIHPIACGTVRVFRPASGYGTLVVVVEHELSGPIAVKNGAGQEVGIKRFLSIYGHLRTTAERNGGTAVSLKDGDTVQPENVIGYVQDDADNGDGAEHLHLGIRLQALAEAERTDTDWFRGYDTTPSQLLYFADPATFLYRMLSDRRTVSWHPAGTVLARMDHPDERWVVATNNVIRALPPTVALTDRLADRAITVQMEELGCYSFGPVYESELADVRIVKFDDEARVYLVHELPDPGRWAFVTHEAFLSWGWRDAEIDVRPASERFRFYMDYPSKGSLLMRDGTLVKAKGESEVSVVSHGERLPFLDWPTFISMGYEPGKIFEVDPALVSGQAYPRGPVITAQTAAYCSGPMIGPPDMAESDRPDPAAPPDFAVTTPVVPPPLPDLGQIPWPDLSAPPVVPPPDLLALPPPDLVVSPSDFWQEPPDLWTQSPDFWTQPPDFWKPPPDFWMQSPDFTVVRDFAITPPDFSVPPDFTPPYQGPSTRYEFRVLDSAGWQASEPYYLRDKWWGIVVCANTGSSSMQILADGWRRCDQMTPLSPFVGSFYSRAHPTWGDNGNLGTIGNSPQRCTPTAGVEWRITDLAQNRAIFVGSSSGLPCVSVGTQDRHGLP